MVKTRFVGGFSVYKKLLQIVFWWIVQYACFKHDGS